MVPHLIWDGPGPGAIPEHPLRLAFLSQGFVTWMDLLRIGWWQRTEGVNRLLQEKIRMGEKNSEYFAFVQCVLTQWEGQVLGCV